MVKLEKTFTIEVEKTRRIKVLCKNCGRELVDFSKVTKIGRIWKIDEVELDWDVDYTVKYWKVYCKCTQKIAEVPRLGVFYLTKKSLQLIY